jgi:hypothetical protein
MSSIGFMSLQNQAFYYNKCTQIGNKCIITLV